jgi:hypothetical protein
MSPIDFCRCASARIWDYHIEFLRVQRIMMTYFYTIHILDLLYCLHQGTFKVWVENPKEGLKEELRIINEKPYSLRYYCKTA